MTKREIDLLKETLPSWDTYKDWTQEQKILDKKLSIAEMMLSNLSYGSDYFEMTKENWYRSNWYRANSRKFDWEELEDLGVKDAYKVVQDLWEEMKDDFAKYAHVERNTYTDSEGLTYNSVKWSD